MNQIKEIYSEVNIFFPENVSRSYEDLIEFNKNITEERNKYLREQITLLTSQIKEIRTKLYELDSNRAEVLSVLQNKDSFFKFKTYQTQMIKIQEGILQLEDKLKSIDKISLFNDGIEELKEKLLQIARDVKKHIKANDNLILSTIRTYFNNIYKEVFSVPAVLYVEPNRYNNIEFKYNVEGAGVSIATAEDEGNTYRKILCVAFDIAVLIAYNSHSFYRFVYHDGVLEGLDNRKKELFINLMKKYCHDFDIQYIFSAIQDDLPINILDSFEKKEICLELNDSGDDGKLFGFSF